MKTENKSEELRAVDALNAIDGDPESDHLIAEDIVMTYLRQSDATAIAEAFEGARYRVGFWYA